MNLLEAIAKEHSKSQRDRIVKWIGTDPRRFASLMKVFLDGPYRITQRAAWPLNCCIEKHPSLLRPHLRRMLENLKSPDIHDSVKRNTVRLLQFVAIPKSLQGLAVANCFDLFRNPKEPIAVKVFSMSVLASIARERPEFSRELKILIEDQIPFASAGFLSRAQKVLKQLA